MRFNHFFLFAFILFVISSGLYGVFHLEISENLNETLPGQRDFSSVQSWMDKQKDLVVFSLDVDEPHLSLDEIDELAVTLSQNLTATGLVEDIQYKNDIDPDVFVSLITENLPIYLEASDYVQLEKLLQPKRIQSALIQSKKTLMSPEGIGQRSRILSDPLGFSTLAFDSFGKMQMAQEIINNGGYFLSKDQNQLLLKGRLTTDIAQSEDNHRARLLLDSLSQSWNLTYPDHSLSYFGTFLVADINATQIKKDVKLTVTITLVSIVLLLIYYYRKAVILVFFLVPGLFGVLSAAAIIYGLHGQISGLALAASAIVFGIVADYSFHFFTHFKDTRDAIGSRNDIMFPLLVSGGTTIVAFLSLLFADSKALKDFGLFTSISLAGTLFFILTGLPLILRSFEKKIKFPAANPLDALFDKIKIGESKPSKWAMLIFVILSGLMLYLGQDVQFEDNLHKINYYPLELQQQEEAIQNINPDTEKRITILSQQTADHTAAWNNQELFAKLSTLQQDGGVKEFFSLAPILISKEEQTLRIHRWNDFWADKKETLLGNFETEALAQNWKPQYFTPFYNLLNHEFAPQNFSSFIASSQNLSDLVITQPESSEIITTLICPKNQVEQIKTQLSTIPGTLVIDSSSIVARIIESVKADFNFLLIYAGLAVFVAFLLIYGNIELTLISFIPMLLSWVWVLGMAALLDIKFNFINIILTTFIFGLGDDFSIFVTDGLLHRYKYKKEVIGQYKTGIILSSITTIIGTGVLIFAKHPALQSIAMLSVLGIAIIVPITFFVQPVLFRFLISNRTEQKKPPFSIANILFSVWGYGVFIAGSFFCVGASFLLRALPLREKTKKAGTHRLLQKISGFQLDILWKTKKRYVGMDNLDFSTPSILIANHTSFFDILALVRLHPKLVLLVNEWVYNSPLFGPAIRYADYIPAYKNMEDQLPKIKELVADGYSIAIFPEGKRSEDGTMGRFHKGAFYLAEELQLDITPIFLYGHGYVMPKHEYYFKDSPCDTVVLPRIAWDDTNYGEGYRSRTKKISAYYKSEFKKYQESDYCLEHAFAPLMYSYYYKSPILPWYFRVKWRYEKHNYENYHQLIGPGIQKIYDLGCGYGYLSYFLWLRDQDRQIIGIDYDDEKVDLAQNSYLKNNHIEFATGQVDQVEIHAADAIILADVLHYLSEDKQRKVLANCDQGLNAGGLLLIRDGIAGHDKKHKWTEKSEKWSTRLIKFNKTNGDLHFFSRQFIEDWARKHHYSLTVDAQSQKSSNMLFILRKT
ncbi:hypothetical protein BFP72_12645 [Reichenbachiella sp. 5M10]|uniref:1-acyl-sn-glycerol-3-phosphate acyltransferase n=1 Tax=Reichenbachiella sp. 5M10 TaxID=1889772 RepID=UPI000C15D67A|nr:1-acyl-sn-glycerol-3-phosphate acyltransferase [Reichenbachiella sp. 5M10]PIB36183.1 hypothetical protein BFP72_12645 [Reichenbachiella sp. 5M10]